MRSMEDNEINLSKFLLRHEIQTFFAKNFRPRHKKTNILKKTFKRN